MDDSSAGPLAPGSISLRIYPLDLSPADVVTEIRREARLAEEAGFDGCMLSEHHGGFPNYLPNPLLAATWALEATDRLWAAPCPMLVSLRPLPHVVEDIAWTHHRFPGRIGLGVAAGALRTDFDLAGVPFDELFPRYHRALAALTDALDGRATGPLADDPALAALVPGTIPVVAGVQAERSTRRAARVGAGLLYDSLQDLDALGRLSATYRAAGGRGSRILIRRVWLGPLPADAAERQMARYRAAAGQRPDGARATEHWAADGAFIVAEHGEGAAAQIAEAMERSGSDAVNLRVFLAGLSPEDVGRQIVRHGAETLPTLRRLLAATTGQGERTEVPD